MSEVFLSYASIDGPVADQVRTILETQRIDVFRDRDIAQGMDWASALERAMADCKCIIVFWSKASVTSRWVQAEAAYGLDDKKLIPVAIDGSSVPRPFDVIQSIDLKGWQHDPAHPGIAELLRAIRQRLQKQSHTFQSEV